MRSSIELDPTETGSQHASDIPLIFDDPNVEHFEDPRPSGPQADPSSSFSITTTTTPLESPGTWKVTRGLPRGIGGRLGRILVPSVQHGVHVKTPPTQLARDEYSAGHNASPQQQSPVDSRDKPYAKRRVDNGQTSPGLDAEETNASMFQLPQPIYGHSPTDAPGHSAHTYALTPASTHTPAQSSSTRASRIHTAPLQSTSGGNLQDPEHYYHSPKPAACSQPEQMLASYQSLHNPTIRTTRTRNSHIPTGPSCSGSGLNIQSTPPMAPGHVPLRRTPPKATELLRTRSVSSPAGPRSIPGGCAFSSVVSPLVFSEPATLFPGDDSIGRRSRPLAIDNLLNSPLNSPITWDGAMCAARSQPKGLQANSEDASFISYHFAEPIITPWYNQSLSSMVVPGGHLVPSVPLRATAPAEDPSSHLPRPHLPANLTASGQPPNSGSGRSGSDNISNVSITRANGKPVSFKYNQQIGPDRSDRTHTRRESKPYLRTFVTRKARPVKYEGNLERLKQRCREHGADEGAIDLLGKIFADEVSEVALTRSLTDAEAETGEFGIVTGKVYTAFLEPIDEGEGAAPRYICRLCHSDQTWRHAKDVVRHLKRDHFGLAHPCDKWYVFNHLLTLASIDSCASWVCSGQKFYTSGERTRHYCK